MRGSAWISDCGKYRYSLTREWSVQGRLTFCMLNPSTADATTDDLTIKKCVRFAKRLGFGEVEVINLFAFRTKDPRDMLLQRDPVGLCNWDAWRYALRQSNELIIAWGVQPDPRMRDQTWRFAGLCGLIGVPLTCLGLTNAGYPRHPSRLPYSAKRILWPKDSTL